MAQYLAALPADRRAALSSVRKATNENLPEGYEEGMQFGMIGWYVPLSVYPAGYGEKGLLNRTPLNLIGVIHSRTMRRSLATHYAKVRNAKTKTEDHNRFLFFARPALHELTV